MLLTLSIENYRSFCAEQTFNLIAANNLHEEGREERTATIPGTKERALRMAGVYGANGTGKSNLVKAMSHIRKFVLEDTKPGSTLPYDPFLFKSESKEEPSVFDVVFVSEQNTYRYGFSHDSKRIHEEWLDVKNGGDESSIFQRSTKQDGTVEIDLGKEAPKKGAAKKKMQALAAVGARPNQLFLTQIISLGDETLQGHKLAAVVRWFDLYLSIVQPDDKFIGLKKLLETDPEFAKFVAGFLKEADTGISKIEAKTEILTADNKKALSEIFDSIPSSEGVFTDGNAEIFRDKDGLKRRVVRTYHTTVENENIPLEFAEESDGTRRLAHLLPALFYSQSEPRVFIIDELERSLHPILAKRFLECFSRFGEGRQGQLLFTTHETHLLNLDVLTRDGIWFTEKDKKGATNMYSLSEFKVRKDLRIEKGYLLGRFGGIPFLGDAEDFFEQSCKGNTK